MSLSLILWILAGIGIFAVILYCAALCFMTQIVARMAEYLVPPAGKFAQINGKKIHYRDEGEGPAILFIHGLGGNFHNFDIPIWPLLKGKYRLIAPDRAGCGYSTMSASDCGKVTDHSDDMAALLDYLGVEKALYVGHSLGGLISLVSGVKHKDKVAGIALLSPLTHAQAGTEKSLSMFSKIAIKPAFWRKIHSQIFAIPANLAMGDEAVDFIFGPQKPPKDLAVHGGAIVAMRPSHAYATSSDFVALEEVLPIVETRWGEITVPTALMIGACDQLVDCTKVIDFMQNKLPQIEIIKAEGIGHMINYAQPLEVAALIDKMADRCIGNKIAQ